MTETATQTKAGDLISVTGHRIGEAPRKGEVLEVLGEEGHLRYRVRWEDGHESIVHPSSDASITHR